MSEKRSRMKLILLHWFLSCLLLYTFADAHPGILFSFQLVHVPIITTHSKYIEQTYKNLFFNTTLHVRHVNINGGILSAVQELKWRIERGITDLSR